MKRIYIAGLYSKNADGSEANVIEVLANMRAGLKASVEVMRAGFAPFCPWLDYQFSLVDDDLIPKNAYYEYSMAWLEVSDIVVVISGVGSGGGVDAEIERAQELGTPVYYSVDEFLAFWNFLGGTGLHTYPKGDSNQRALFEMCKMLESRGLIHRLINEPDHVCFRKYE